MIAPAISPNGKPQRKQLSSQLDRLDGIIDCLADALPDAVASATREGTRQAMQAVLTELLTHPEVLAQLRAALTVSPEPIPTSMPVPTVETQPKPSFFQRIKSTVRKGVQHVVNSVTAIAGTVHEKLRSTKARVLTTVAPLVATARIVGKAMPLPRFVMVAGIVSVVVAVLSYVLPHSVSAIVSGLGGAWAALSLQVGIWFKRSTQALGFASN